MHGFYQDPSGGRSGIHPSGAREQRWPFGIDTFGITMLLGLYQWGNWCSGNRHGAEILLWIKKLKIKIIPVIDVNVIQQDQLKEI